MKSGVEVVLKAIQSYHAESMGKSDLVLAGLQADLCQQARLGSSLSREQYSFTMPARSTDLYDLVVGILQEREAERAERRARR